MATSYTEAKTIGDVVKYEAPLGYSREKVTITSGQNLQIGDILETATGKKIILATPANADSIMLEDTGGALGGDAEHWVLARHSMYDDGQVDYNSQTKATTDAALKALGIIPRPTPVETSTQST